MNRITLILFSIYCFISCNNEIISGIHSGGEGEGEGNPSQLQLFIPAAERVNLYSTATESECMIDTVWVLVFDGQTKRWVEKIGRSEILNRGQATQLLPQLSHKLENGNTVICIANVAPNPDTANVTLATINTCFQLSKPYWSGGDYLPMYGKIDHWAAASAYTCRMTRAVAKIQVQMGTAPSDVTGNFNPENVTYQLFRYPAGGYVEPSSSFTGISVAGSPTSALRILQKAGATEAETSAFICEYPFSAGTPGGGAVGIKDFRADRLHLILTKGTAPTARYYRLDFFNPADSTFLDVRRNCHYLFTINKIRSEGYATLSHAQNLPGSNIEYTVRITDHSQSVTSNGQYAIVTSVDTVKIPGDLATPTRVATFRYMNPTGITLASIENAITVEAGSVQPIGATLHIASPLTITDVSQELQITSSGNLTEGVIRFQLGNITHRLYVKKSP